MCMTGHAERPTGAHQAMRPHLQEAVYQDAPHCAVSEHSRPYFSTQAHHTVLPRNAAA